MADIEKIFYFDDSYNDYSESPGTLYRDQWLSVYGNYGNMSATKISTYVLNESKKNETEKILQKYANINLELTMQAFSKNPSLGRGNRLITHIPHPRVHVSIGVKDIESLNGLLTFRRLINTDIVKKIEKISTYLDHWGDCKINSHTNPQPPFLKITGDIPTIEHSDPWNVGYGLYGYGGDRVLATASSQVFPSCLFAKMVITSKNSSYQKEIEEFEIIVEHSLGREDYLYIKWNVRFDPTDNVPLGEHFVMRLIGDFELIGNKIFDVAIFHTIDSVPTQPTLLTPNQSFISTDSPNIFKWQHNVATTSYQLKFDLEYKLLNDDRWTPLASVKTNDQFYTVPANTLPAGKLQWRVRTYNTQGVASVWSEPANILAKGRPPKPIGLTTTETQIPTLSWQAENQAGYRILINGNGVVYDSNEIFGTEKQYKLPFFLEQGKRYELSVAIANNQGYWSEYTTTFINVQNNPMPTIKSVCVRNMNHVKFMWEHNSNYRKYLIYRDGIFLGQTKSNQYEDWLAFKNHAYKVIAVGYNDFVKESEIVYKNCMMNFTNIHEIGTHQFIDVSKNIGSNLTVSSALESNIAYHSFDGRQYPVAVSDGVVAKTHTLSVSFFNTEKENISNFEKLVGKLVCFKSVKQYALIGVLTINSKTQDQKYTQYEYTITEVTMSKEFDIND